MKFFISSVLLVLTVLKTAEPMPFEEKQDVVEGDGAHRVLRGLQTDLTYKGQICSTEASGVMPCTAANTVCQPEQWDYWKLYLRAETDTFEVDRISCNLHPAMSLYEGVGRTFPLGCFGDLGTDELREIFEVFAGNPVPDYCSNATSPSFDPKVSFTPGKSARFTLAVVNYASTVGTCRATEGYRYKVKINPPPSCA